MGYYSTRDAGATWMLEVANEAGEAFADHVQSHTRTAIVMGGGRVMVAFEPGGTVVAQDFSGCGNVPGTIVAVTADIRLDRFYCYSPEGHTYYTATDGGTVMSQGVDLPAGVQPQPRGLGRDGEIKDLLYFAAGTAGVYKSVDGFASTAGYFRIRQQSIGNAGAASVWTMIGAGELSIQARTEGTVVVSTIGVGKMLRIGAGAAPDDWQAVSFDDSAWTAPVEQVAGEPFTISGAAWITESTGLKDDGSNTLHRRTFTLPVGYITSATLYLGADNFLLAAWINGVFVYGNDDTSGVGMQAAVQQTVPASLLIPNGDNTLAIRYQNEGLIVPSGDGLAYRLEVN